MNSSVSLLYSTVKPSSLAVANDNMLAAAPIASGIRPNAGSTNSHDSSYFVPAELAPSMPVICPILHGFLLIARVGEMHRCVPDAQSSSTKSSSKESRWVVARHLSAFSVMSKSLVENASCGWPSMLEMLCVIVLIAADSRSSACRPPGSMFLIGVEIGDGGDGSFSCCTL